MDNLEELHYNRERYVDSKQCEEVISLDNGGRFQRKFCSDYCRKKTIEKTKTLSRIAMGPECDGMVQTDFFDGAMAVLLEHPDVYLAGSAKRE